MASENLNGLKTADLGIVGILHIITIGTISLSGLIPLSCSKSAKASKPVPAVSASTNAPAPANMRDLGTLQLTNLYETRIDLGGGKSCTIKPLRIDRRNLQLTMTVEARSADGKIQGLNIMNLVTKPDQPFEVNLGGLDLTLTPQLAAE